MVPPPPTLDTSDFGPPEALTTAFAEKLNHFMVRFVGTAIAAGLDEALSETPSVDLKIKILLNEFLDRPDLSEIFVKTVSSMRNREEAIPIEECVRIFGVQNTLAFLITYKLADHLQCKSLLKDAKTGRILQQPGQILKYAVKVQQAFEEERRHVETAFAAGLVFDLLTMIIATDYPPGDQKRLTDFLDARFQRGMGIIAYAQKLARSMKKLRLEQYLAAGPLLREAAKVAMAMSFPPYQDFLKACDKIKLPLSLRAVAERERFGGDYQAFSIVLSWSFDLVSGVGESILQFDAPHVFLEERKADEFDLAALCFLAAFIGRVGTSDKALSGAVKAAELRHELKGFDLTFTLAAILKKEGG
ncbi:hypothetical protein WDW37_19920 [Bdellovibrionota bacterium FG-1]